MVRRHGGDAGGILGVQRLLSKHAKAVEADLLRYFSIDLMDLWRGRLSFRRLAVLIRYLPSESWTQTALRDEREHDLSDLIADEPEAPAKFGPWALENYQLAQLRDEIAELRFVVARTAGSENYPEPQPTPRPGANRPIRRQTAAGVAYLKNLRAERKRAQEQEGDDQ